MADRRIRIDTDKTDLVGELAETAGEASPFKLRADVLAFVASLGFRHGKSLPLSQPTKDPIRLDVFVSHNYGTLINLLAVCHTKDPKVLANTDADEDRRATVFEEYANGGLQLLKERLHGVVDCGGRTLKLIQLIAEMRKAPEAAEAGVLDISDLVV